MQEVTQRGITLRFKTSNPSVAFIDEDAIPRFHLHAAASLANVRIKSDFSSGAKQSPVEDTEWMKGSACSEREVLIKEGRCVG